MQLMSASIDSQEVRNRFRLDIANTDGDVLTLTVFSEVLSKRFEKDDMMKDYFGNTEKLEEELLSLENVNLSYSLAKLVISEIKHHETLETDRDAVNNT